MPRTLKPIYDKLSYSNQISKVIYAVLYEEIFAPLFAILEIPESRKNDKTTALEAALRDGKIFYQDGVFVGKLNATISKELRGIGAVYNKIKKAYALKPDAIPLNVKLAISKSNELAKEKLRNVEDFLKAKQDSDVPKINFDPAFGATLSDLDKQFHITTHLVTGKTLEIPLDPHYAEQIKEGYSDNLNKYIQKWHDEQILKLRVKVTQNVAQGFRAETMIQDIIQERGVTQRKAKFLARQETSLMVSKYREIRYKDAGLNNYIWSTSRDVRVRHDHRELNGKIFSFDHPPITDKHTGARNNPGEDYNCRCVAIPVLSDIDAYETQLLISEK